MFREVGVETETVVEVEVVSVLVVAKARKIMVVMILTIGRLSSSSDGPDDGCLFRIARQRNRDQWDWWNAGHPLLEFTEQGVSSLSGLSTSLSLIFQECSRLSGFLV